MFYIFIYQLIVLNEFDELLIEKTYFLKNSVKILDFNTESASILQL